MTSKINIQFDDNRDMKLMSKSLKKSSLSSISNPCIGILINKQSYN